MGLPNTKNEKTNIPKLERERGGVKKLKSRPLNQTQPEVYGKVKWMATSERVNLLLYMLIDLKMFTKFR